MPSVEGTHSRGRDDLPISLESGGKCQIMTTHLSTLAWKIPWAEEPIVHGISIVLCLYIIEIMTIIVQEEGGKSQAYFGITGTCTTQELVWFI